MLNVLICDDDLVFCKQLRELLLETSREDISTITLFSHESQLLFFLEEQKITPNIIFMDIQLQYESGIEVAKTIIKGNPSVHIIFMSAYDSYYLEVYNVEHLYLLKKPIDAQRLQDAFARAKAKLEQDQSDYLPIKTRQGVWKFPFKSIYFFEKEKRKILIYGCDGLILDFYGKLPQIQAASKGRFVCPHNSYLVNLSYIHSIMENQLTLMNGIVLPISRNRKTEIKLAFSSYLERQLLCIF